MPVSPSFAYVMLVFGAVTLAGALFRPHIVAAIVPGWFGVIRPGRMTQLFGSTLCIIIGLWQLDLIPEDAKGIVIVFWAMLGLISFAFDVIPGGDDKPGTRPAPPAVRTGSRRRRRSKRR